VTEEIENVLHGTRIVNSMKCHDKVFYLIGSGIKVQGCPDREVLAVSRSNVVRSHYADSHYSTAIYQNGLRILPLPYSSVAESGLTPHPCQSNSTRNFLMEGSSIKENILSEGQFELYMFLLFLRFGDHDRDAESGGISTSLGPYIKYSRHYIYFLREIPCPGGGTV
jgi:hypothetical protein